MTDDDFDIEAAYDAVEGIPGRTHQEILANVRAARAGLHSAMVERAMDASPDTAIEGDLIEPRPASVLLASARNHRVAAEERVHERELRRSRNRKAREARWAERRHVEELTRRMTRFAHEYDRLRSRMEKKRARLAGQDPIDRSEAEAIEARSGGADKDRRIARALTAARTEIQRLRAKTKGRPGTNGTNGSKS